MSSPAIPSKRARSSSSAPTPCIANPAFWPQPERFLPERFSTENAAGRPRYAYFPFGGGPRQCIGKDFALMELQLALPRLVQAFEFELDPGKPIECLPQITLRPKHGIWVRLRPAS